MSIAFFDFTDKINRRFFWLVIACLILAAIASGTLLISRYQERKIIDAEIELSNYAGKFVAPRNILDPSAIFNDLRGYVDPEVSVSHAKLPEPIAPPNALNPDSEFNFRPPVIKESE